MAYHAALEEGEWPDALGTVNDLVWYDKVARPDVFLQRADGREGDDGADANVSQGGNVGLVLDLVRSILMVQAVS